MHLSSFPKSEWEWSLSFLQICMHKTKNCNLFCVWLQRKSISRTESWLKITGLSENFVSILRCFCLCFQFRYRFLNFKSSLRKLLEKVSAPRKHAEWRYKIFSSCSCCQGGSLICCTHHCSHVTPSCCRSGKRDGCVHGFNSETIISVVTNLGQCRWNEMFQCWIS